MSDKALVTGFKYREDSFEKDLREAIEQTEWNKFIKHDARVFVKPNLTTPFFKKGVTTNGFVTEMVLKILGDYTSQVYVGESDGGSDSFTAEYSLENHNLPDICNRTGCKLINLSKQERIRVTDYINGKKVEVTLPRPLFGMDITVSIPVFKVHVVTKVSLSIKNLWGCHPDTYRLMDHTNLSERLTLIAKILHLKLVVVDAIYGLNKRGPMNGEVVDVGGIIVGNNPVSTDAITTGLIGFDPQSIDHIVVAGNAGLGSYNTNDISILNDLKPFQQHFYVQPTIVEKLSTLTFKNPLLNKLVMHSPLTKPIYKIMGCKYHKKILKPGDET